MNEFVLIGINKIIKAIIWNLKKRMIIILKLKKIRKTCTEWKGKCEHSLEALEKKTNMRNNQLLFSLGQSITWHLEKNQTHFNVPFFFG